MRRERGVGEEGRGWGGGGEEEGIEWMGEE